MSDSGLSGIADRAKVRIEELLAQVKREDGRDAIPAIVWVDSDLNSGIVASQAAIGFYFDREEIEADLVTVSGMEVVVCLTTEDAERFSGKILDFDGERFFFV